MECYETDGRNPKPNRIVGGQDDAFQLVDVSVL
jgi:hypothetical protein